MGDTTPERPDTVSVPQVLGYLSPSVPRLPPKFLPRPEDLDALKEKILNSTQQPVAVTGTRRGVSIQGMGGIGKSVLAAVIARDEDVRQAFPDGVFWVSVGQEPNVLSLQTELARELGETSPEFSDVAGGKKRLTELLTAKRCFVVLDDIWQEQHLRSFDVLGSQGQMLITTRDSGLVTGIGAVEHPLNVLSSQQARSLLAGWTGCEPEDLPPQADKIARECGYLPLALS
ncbi:MAG: NB-ARC domain-containing protein, partial [Cyanobacteria bacterium P01_F01_bin.13]